MRHFKFILIIILSTMVFASCDESDLFSDDPRDAFVGDWSVSENNAKKSAYLFYDVSIEKSVTDSTAVYIYNFYEIGNTLSVRAVVDGSRISLPSQTVDGFTFYGSGTISYNDKSIEWLYTADYNNGTVETLKATFTKK